MSQKTSKKPRKKKQSNLSDKVLTVDNDTLQPTSTHVQPYKVPEPKDLLPHALHRQIAELKARVENLELVIELLKDKKKVAF